MKRTIYAVLVALGLLGSAAAAHYGPHLLQSGDRLYYNCNGVPQHWANNPQAGYIDCGPYATPQPTPTDPKGGTPTPTVGPKPL